MPIIALRDAPAYTLPILANGQGITTTAMNGYQDAASNLAGRGGYSQTAIAAKINGQTHCIVGIKGGNGGAYSWINGKFQREFLVPMGSGINAMSLEIGLRLQPTQSDPDALLGFYGGQVKIDAVFNGVAKRLYSITWRECLGYSLGARTDRIPIELGDLFKLPVNNPLYLALVLTYDPVEGAEKYYGTPNTWDPNITQPQNSQPTNPAYFQGVTYFGFSAYRNCSGC